MPIPTTSSDAVDHFIDGLCDAPETLFNPWYATDEYDLFPEAPIARRDNLKAYLLCRRNARLVLVAEALGYNGGRFSGIAMTSERMLLGYHTLIRPQELFGANPPPRRRTSNPDLAPNKTAQRRGFTERTATIVWRALYKGLGLHPCNFILWNSVPWHPHRPGEMLSNRPPTRCEQQAGKPHLIALRALFPSARLVAVGNKAQAALADLGLCAYPVRHPANGGAGDFRRGISNILYPPG